MFFKVYFALLFKAFGGFANPKDVFFFSIYWLASFGVSNVFLLVSSFCLILGLLLTTYCGAGIFIVATCVFLVGFYREMEVFLRMAVFQLSNIEKKREVQCMCVLAFKHT